MPNGGFPLFMRLRPRGSSEFVVVCEGPKVMLFDSGEWERTGVRGKPVLRLDEDEGEALARFIAHWADSRGVPPASAPARPDVAYDL